jgi:hypothetical protein
VAACREHGLEIALDFAIQCSPDHPWLKQHPEWFRAAPTARSATPRIRPRSTRTSSTSTSNADGAMPDCGWRCATSCCTGQARACGSSASTIRTPSRCRSGNG